jgi:hypothetical protein
LASGWAASTTTGYSRPTCPAPPAGDSYLQALPDIDLPLLVPTEAITAAPAAGYPIQFTTPGTYTVWTRTISVNLRI